MGKLPKSAKAMGKGPPHRKTPDAIVQCYDELVLDSVGRIPEPKGAVQLTFRFRSYESAMWRAQAQNIRSAQTTWADIDFERYIHLPVGKNFINDAICWWIALTIGLICRSE